MLLDHSDYFSQGLLSLGYKLEQVVIDLVLLRRAYTVRRAFVNLERRLGGARNTPPQSLSMLPPASAQGRSGRA
jgi:hypothetical protein